MNWKATITYRSDITNGGNIVVGFTITDGKKEYQNAEITCRPEQVESAIKQKLADFASQSEIAETIDVGMEITLDGISQSDNKR